MDTLSTILVPTDFTASSRRATQLALRIAHDAGASVVFLHTPSEPRLDDDVLKQGIRDQIENRARDRMAELVRDAGKIGVTVDTEIRTGDSPAAGILHVAVRCDAGLIVLGARGSRRKHDLGNVSREVFRRSDRPVLTVPPLADGEDAEVEDETPPFRRMLVPTDFSEVSELALQAARSIARTFGSTVLLLHVVEEFVPPAVYGIEVNPIRDLAAEIEQRAREEMMRMGASFDEVAARVEHHIAGGHAPSQIVDFALEKDVDAIVQTSRGGRIERFLVGSVADRVVRTAPCPVLTLKPDGRPL